MERALKHYKSCCESSPSACGEGPWRLPSGVIYVTVGWGSPGGGVHQGNVTVASRRRCVLDGWRGFLAVAISSTMSEEVEEKVSEAKMEEDNKDRGGDTEGMKHITEAYVRATDVLFEWSKSLEPLQVRPGARGSGAANLFLCRRVLSRRSSMWSRCSTPAIRFILATAV